MLIQLMHGLLDELGTIEVDLNVHALWQLTFNLSYFFFHGLRNRHGISTSLLTNSQTQSSFAIKARNPFDLIKTHAGICHL
ncbi:hypothetical protein D3C72_1688230 [compost metagenome]